MHPNPMCNIVDAEFSHPRNLSYFVVHYRMNFVEVFRSL